MRDDKEDLDQLISCLQKKERSEEQRGVIREYLGRFKQFRRLNDISSEKSLIQNLEQITRVKEYKEGDIIFHPGGKIIKYMINVRGKIITCSRQQKSQLEEEMMLQLELRKFKRFFREQFIDPHNPVVAYLDINTLKLIEQFKNIQIRFNQMRDLKFQQQILQNQENRNYFFSPQVKELLLVKKGKSFKTGEVIFDLIKDRTTHFYAIASQASVFTLEISDIEFHQAVSQVYQQFDQIHDSLLKLMKKYDNIPLANISKHFELQNFSMNDRVFSKGEPTEYIYFISQGQVAICFSYQSELEKLTSQSLKDKYQANFQLEDFSPGKNRRKKSLEQKFTGNQDQLVDQFPNSQYNLENEDESDGEQVEAYLLKQNVNKRKLIYDQLEEVMVIGESELFGYEDFLSNTVRSFSVLSQTENLVLYRISKPQFTEFFQQKQELKPFIQIGETRITHFESLFYEKMQKKFQLGQWMDESEQKYLKSKEEKRENIIRQKRSLNQYKREERQQILKKKLYLMDIDEEVMNNSSAAKSRAAGRSAQNQRLKREIQVPENMNQLNKQEIYFAQAQMIDEPYIRELKQNPVVQNHLLKMYKFAQLTPTHRIGDISMRNFSSDGRNTAISNTRDLISRKNLDVLQRTLSEIPKIFSNDDLKQNYFSSMITTSANFAKTPLSPPQNSDRKEKTYSDSFFPFKKQSPRLDTMKIQSYSKQFMNDQEQVLISNLENEFKFTNKIQVELYQDCIPHNIPDTVNNNPHFRVTFQNPPGSKVGQKINLKTYLTTISNNNSPRTPVTSRTSREFPIQQSPEIVYLNTSTDLQKRPGHVQSKTFNIQNPYNLY